MQHLPCVMEVERTSVEGVKGVETLAFDRRHKFVSTSLIHARSFMQKHYVSRQDHLSLALALARLLPRRA
jgi:hypothetical protein